MRTFLRVSGPLAFAFPLALACLTRQAVAAGALAFVSATTIWVHRDKAAPRYGLREKADHCAILLWVAHNAAVTLACAPRALKNGESAWRLVQPLLLAACALAFARARLAFAYRDPRRVLCHAALHCSAAAGTYLLLLHAFCKDCAMESLLV